MSGSWAIRRDGDGATHPIGIAVDGDLCGAGAGFVWIHADLRDDAAIRWLHDASGLAAGVVGALTAIETRPRSEQFDDGALVNLRGLGATPEDDPDTLASLRLWVERGRVISVGLRTLVVMDALRRDMEAGRLCDPGDVVVAAAIRISATMDQAVAALGDEIDSCEADLKPDDMFAMRRSIARVRAEAIGYRRFVVPQRQALDRLAALPADWLGDDDRIHLREAGDRFARMAEELEAVRERSALLHEQLTDMRAEQIEGRTLVLSVVALVFLPLTFLTGLLGMNVEGIPFAKEPWAFGAVVALCVAVATLITGYFVKARWFR